MGQSRTPGNEKQHETNKEEGQRRFEQKKSDAWPNQCGPVYHIVHQQRIFSNLPVYVI